jgi:superfamily II DNA or RNA helicase
MKQSALKISEEARVIFATYSMAAEALDIPTLNTLFMVTPRREIEQSVGRILRKIDMNNRPIIYDFVDELPTFINQGKYRHKFYNKMKFEQNIINVENNIIIDTQNNIIEIDDNCTDFIDD